MHIRCYIENKANDCFVDTKESFSMVLRAMLLAFSVYCLLSRKILLLNSKHFNWSRMNKRSIIVSEKIYQKIFWSNNEWRWRKWWPWITLLKRDWNFSGKKLGEERGIKLGEKNGMQKILHDLVRKKLIKNKSLEQIAEEIEESVDTVSPMYVQVKREMSDVKKSIIN